jgi:pimeloyl-ACP methyl ester carboxylesterase
VATVTERSVHVNGIDLHLAEAGPGSGPPVVLLHGFPESWKMWRHQVPALAGAGHRVLAPDLRGFGETSRPAEVEAYKLRTLVADVTGLLDLLGIERAAVVGHDWGAGLAWRVAMFAPGRVERLVVVSVGHPLAGIATGLAQWRMSWYMMWFLLPGVAERVLPADDWAFYRRWAWNDAERGQDPDLDRQLADLSRAGALVAGLNWYRANIDPVAFVAPDPARFSLPTVACPTMGVWSSDDFALTEAQMTHSERYVTGPWRYERIEAVDHWVPVHAPDRLNRLLLEFLPGEPAQPPQPS